MRTSGEYNRRKIVQDRRQASPDAKPSSITRDSTPLTALLRWPPRRDASSSARNSRHLPKHLARVWPARAGQAPEIRVEQSQTGHLFSILVEKLPRGNEKTPVALRFRSSTGV